MTTVTATRIVTGDPASTVLLLAGPSGLEFWPGISHVDGLVSPVSAVAALAGEPNRRLVIHSEPPKRTPTAYVTTFSVVADGLPSASGCVRVTRQGWTGTAQAPGAQVPEQKGGEVAGPTAAVTLELRSDVDFEAGLEQEIAAAAREFLDNVAEFASRNAPAAHLSA